MEFNVGEIKEQTKIVTSIDFKPKKGIKVLHPSINESLKHFTYIDDKTIRYGLKAIK